MGHIWASRRRLTFFIYIEICLNILSEFQFDFPRHPIPVTLSRISFSLTKPSSFFFTETNSNKLLCLIHFSLYHLLLIHSPFVTNSTLFSSTPAVLLLSAIVTASQPHQCVFSQQVLFFVSIFTVFNLLVQVRLYLRTIIQVLV